ncbi:uncharacterized protein LOC128957333 [Oppia nitens]|uniref:uncharacterized protein LOC128957333 n=1 Tax=Oppia nitens TaxID=1686743 RepID=UPI0023DC248C|nr:uncharacterized protein LOC128957333 [Oppia nitens]
MSSSPTRTNFQSIPLLKPSAIKDPAMHFPPVTIPSMCFPFPAIYGQNPYSGLVGNNLSTFLSPHAIARQMSFLGNTFSHNLSAIGSKGCCRSPSHPLTCRSPSQSLTCRSSPQSLSCRSPSQPLTCPLCSISLEGVDIRSHFYEEVCKVETQRKLHDFAYIPSDSSESNEQHFESRSCSSYQKKLPYSRWETFQRVRQNRHSRLTAIIRQTRKKFESESDFRTESVGQPLTPLRNDSSIWNNGSDVSTTSQRVEDEEDNDSSSENNVDVVSDLADNDKEMIDCDKSSEASNSGHHNWDTGGQEAKSGSDVTDGDDIKPLENGLVSQQSNIHNNSDTMDSRFSRNHLLIDKLDQRFAESSESPEKRHRI